MYARFKHLSIPHNFKFLAIRLYWTRWGFNTVLDTLGF